MARIRLLDQKPQYRKADGTLAGLGSKIYFYLTGTTTPKDVYNAPTGGTNLGPEIELDADGRHSEDVYLADDAAYRVDVRDADDASIPGYPLDDVGGAASAGADIPDPADGSELQVWSTDGTPGGGYWRDVNELPDSTGHGEDEVLYSDGAGGGTWAPLPEAATYDATDLPGGITQPSTTVVTIGQLMIQCGSDTAPTNGTIRVTKAVSFSPAFTGTPKVVCTPTVDGVTGDTPSGGTSPHATSVGTTGFTASFFAGAEANGGNTNITSAVTFDWIAIGAYVVP